MAIFGPKAWFYPFGKMSVFMGLTHGFGLKMGLFRTFFFQAIQHRKMSITIFLNQKTPSEAIKKRSSKSRKIDIFPKGLSMVLVQKWPFFQLFLQAIQDEKMSFTIFKNEKTPFQALKPRSSKSRKIDIFPWNGPWNWSKKQTFFQLFYLDNIDKENVFYNIVEPKNVFLGYKNKKFKKSKN